MKIRTSFTGVKASLNVMMLPVWLRLCRKVHNIVSFLQDMQDTGVARRAKRKAHQLTGDLKAPEPVMRNWRTFRIDEREARLLTDYEDYH
jgi:hypothetical protein